MAEVSSVAEGCGYSLWDALAGVGEFVFVSVVVWVRALSVVVFWVVAVTWEDLFVFILADDYASVSGSFLEFSVSVGFVCRFAAF